MKFVLSMVLAFMPISLWGKAPPMKAGEKKMMTTDKMAKSKMMEDKAMKKPGVAKAVFAGGCFWCMEPPFEKQDGVKSVISGFIDGKKPNPTYKEVASGGTKWIEAVEVTYDPQKITYNDLLEIFWRQVNPTDAGGQFVDRGHQYTTGIFYYTDEQRQAAEASKKKLAASKRFDKPIVTVVKKAGKFYSAEKYHQDYYKENPLRYKFYRLNSGRDQYLEDVWGNDRPYKVTKKKGKMKGGMEMKGTMNEEMDVKNKMNEGAMYKKPPVNELKKTLSDMQFKVTQKEGTEPPFKNEYWDNKKAGIYVDIVSGEPLFSSLDKFDSGTGWPSFTKPLVPDYIVEKKDRKLFMTRTEVRSKHGDSHLGHVFDDGPAPTGMRYCINSASLKFIPVEELKGTQYEKFLPMFVGDKMAGK